ncbi:UDP-2,4-diacetamido-2,4,6-trideoxy-beta-L-altropyranose hydrolase [Synechococcus sp. MU1611]|uniref:UDP-2,4-diacetamido-2,4, 6-trideoxy-beta-L-altropyranose hydrolase n=1 Tax=Synechococcus sp. MU1611 TaxID=2508345 RepID=UPI001CF904CB|nr:UDP-2,4-diacetamido-2,4,6-trideoxy-beta-L-altropyranose hydrolase [Synechococcus sp. MU1611]MCB4412108.1 UDP-2,4-diacetamido-2,4,6-trideoxy-beta-L-altropyranose hydrolase [Synechococcus sp. MU1611]
MKQIIIRCDASNLIGTGHVMRCRTLARRLRQRDADITFICRCQDGDLITLLEEEFKVLTLSHQKISKNIDNKNRPSKNQELYNTWLGCTQEIDAMQTIQALRDNIKTNVQWLIVDHYGIGKEWELCLRNYLQKQEPLFRILVIDDLANRCHDADIILDQNLSDDATESRYQELVTSSCLKLIGPQYALMNPEYAALRELTPNRNDLQRILIFFGGIDNFGLTFKTLRALNTARFSHLAIDIVVSMKSLNYSDVVKLADQRPKTTIYSSLPSLACLMVRADLAIGAGGTTTWERACLRLPTFIVSVAENQIAASKALDKYGFIKFLGTHKNVDETDISSAVDSWENKKMAFVSGEYLTDGYGADRIAIALTGYSNAIYLRDTNTSDEALLLRWANDSSVRAVSLNRNNISMEQHHSWFENSLLNPDRIHLIAVTRDNAPIGQIRFDRLPDSSSVRLSFSLDKAVRGQGLAVPFIRAALNALQQRWGDDIEVFAEVLSENHASQACFARSRFQQKPSEVVGLTIWQWHPMQDP